MKAFLAHGGALLVTALVVAGCGTGGSATVSLPSVAASPADTPTPPASSAPTTSPAASSAPAAATARATSGPTAGGILMPCADLTLTIASDKAAYRTGETVHLTATLTNAGAVDCTIQGGAQRGFTVASGSTAIWRSGCSTTPAGHTATEPCPQFLALMPIKAGQTLSRTQDWSQQADGTDQQVVPGNYLVAESWGGSNASATITIS